MRWIFSLWTFISMLNFSANAQQNDSNFTRIIKVNLSGLFFKNISVQYERQISQKSSVLLSVNAMPYGKLNFQNFIVGKYNLGSSQFDQIKMGGIGVKPELRFYLGEAAPEKFYVGPYLAFAHYKLSVPLVYNKIEKKSATFEGKFNSVSLGLQLGTQLRLSKNMTLDCMILGPDLGSGSGNFVFSGALDSTAQVDLYNAIDLVRRKTFLDIVDDVNITASGARVETKGAILGMRIAFNLGIRF